MFGSRPPQKDRRGRFWDWLNPKIGQSLNGWLCGPVIGVETHYLGRTQPCRRFITNGRMTCYCQRANLGAEWKGYVPLFDSNGVQAFAIIGERYAELAFSIPLFSPVTVSRLRSAGQPVCVKQSDWTDQPPPARGDKLKPKDIRPWLLKLWGDKDLIEWFAAHPEAATEHQAVTLTKEESRLRDLDERRKPRSEPGTLADELAKIPHLNGKGKH